jgi:hypothetical protein
LVHCASSGLPGPMPGPDYQTLNPTAALSAPTKLG